jgi:hypothetical protein
MTPSLRLASLLLAACLGGVAAVTATHVADARAAAPADTVTVFVDATFGFRKDHLARQLTKSHTEYAAKGYRYVDMAPYTENGDLVGFFVSYTRN